MDDTAESESVVTDYNIFMLKAGKKYQILRNGKLYKSKRVIPRENSFQH